VGIVSQFRQQAKLRVDCLMPLHHRAGRIVAACALLAANAATRVGWAEQSPAIPTGTAFLAGQVVEAGSSRPVAGALVSLTGPTGPQRPVVADGQGRFFFANLPVGTYLATSSALGYATPAQVLRPISLSAAQRVTDVKLRLARVGSIAGTVRDDAGDPVVGTEVMVFRRAITGGRAQLQRVAQVRTDDRGAYRAFALRASDYLVCACARDPIPFDGVLLTTLASEPLQLLGVAARALSAGADVASLDSSLRTYAPTFYPSAISTTQAARVSVSPGADLSGIDVSVAAVRAVRVSGTVVGAPGPIDAMSIRLVPATEADDDGLWALAPMLVQPDGRFDFAGVPPGQYVLRVTYTEKSGGAAGPSGAALAFLGARGAGLGAGGAAVPEAPPYWAAEPIAVGDEDVRGLVVALRRGPSVSGRVEFSGNAPPPTTQMLGRASVLVQALTRNPTFSGWTPSGRLTPDGGFTIPAVVPGRHLISTAGMPPSWSNLRSVVVAGVDMTDLPLEIAAADITGVILTFTNTPLATLSGKVTSAVAGDEDVSVLVFPTDRRFWADPSAARRRFRAVAVRLGGLFSASGLPAGDYLLAAVPDEATLEWQDAGRLEALARTALGVTLADGERKTVEVRR